ncbi:MAG: hypothetical protein KAI73_01535 [Rhodospirillaceae bacterium]|nr:hypothetical protein [Rhodospirillaceae bacterium]
MKRQTAISKYIKYYLQFTTLCDAGQGDTEYAGKVRDAMYSMWENLTNKERNRAHAALDRMD